MQQRRLAFVLLAPAFLLVGFTTVYPMVSSFWTSFHVLNLAKSLDLGRFVGLQNYTDAFTDDPEFWTVMRRHVHLRRDRRDTTILAGARPGDPAAPRRVRAERAADPPDPAVRHEPGPDRDLLALHAEPGLAGVRADHRRRFPSTRNLDYLASPTLSMGR